MADLDGFECPDCAVLVGFEHKYGCDVAACLYTGMQRLSCDQFDHSDCGRDVWTGQHPGEAECREYGLWARYAAGLGWVECRPYTLGATPDFNRLMTEGSWDRDNQRWIWPRGKAV